MMIRAMRAVGVGFLLAAGWMLFQPMPLAANGGMNSAAVFAADGSATDASAAGAFATDGTATDASAMPDSVAADSTGAESKAPADSTGAGSAATADSSAAKPPIDPWRGQNEEFIWYEPPKPPPEPEKEKPYKEWAEALKFTEKQEGLFTIHRKRQEVYFEIAPADLERTYLVALTMSRGIGERGLFGGTTWTTSVVKLRREGDAIQLIEMNPRFYADAGTPRARAVDLSYGRSVLFSFPIVSINAENDHILASAAGFLASDFAGLETWLPQIIGSPARVDGDRTSIGTIRAFPKNIEIDVDFTFTPQMPANVNLDTVTDSRYIPIGMHYSFSLLEDTGYRPRLADSRVGYFPTVLKDFTRDDRETNFRRYINRWNLVKKDSAAALSEPVQPIIFYVDRTVPDEYAPWIKEGIELWQGAFECAGFKNAIQVLPAPDDSSYAPEDVRYNTIRWIVSSQPTYGAIGPSRVDPRTGQILDADVLIDASMVNSWKVAWWEYMGQKSATASRAIAGSAVSGSNDSQTSMIPAELLPSPPPEVQWLADMSAALDGRVTSALPPWQAQMPEAFGWPVGEPANVLALNGGAARAALVARGVIKPGESMPDSILGEAVKWLVCHEVGHTLGLRHNFKSSSEIPFAKLNDRDYIDKNGFGSVMDYMAANIAPTEEEQGYYYRGALGEYDRWAIRYGYTPIVADSPDGELPTLEAIAAESAQLGHAYGTDEDAYMATAVDPLTATFDLSAEPLVWAQNTINWARALLTDGQLEDRSVLPGKELTTLRSSTLMLFWNIVMPTNCAARYIGGQYFNHDHRGDPGARDPFEPVPPELQRAALNMLLEQGLREDVFPVPPELLNRLAPNRWSHWGSEIWSPGFRMDFPLHDLTLWAQSRVVMELTDPARLVLVNELNYKQPDALSLAEIYDGLTRTIWGNLDERPVRIDGFRRNLQRFYARRLVDIWMDPAGGYPSEARALARLQIVTLRGRIDQALASNPEMAVRAHLEESRARFDQALEATIEVTMD